MLIRYILSASFLFFLSSQNSLGQDLHEWIRKDPIAVANRLHFSDKVFEKHFSYLSVSDGVRFEFLPTEPHVSLEELKPSARLFLDKIENDLKVFRGVNGEKLSCLGRSLEAWMQGVSRYSLKHFQLMMMDYVQIFNSEEISQEHYLYKRGRILQMHSESMLRPLYALSSRPLNMEDFLWERALFLNFSNLIDSPQSTDGRILNAAEFLMHDFTHWNEYSYRLSVPDEMKKQERLFGQPNSYLSVTDHFLFGLSLEDRQFFKNEVYKRVRATRAFLENLNSLDNLGSKRKDRVLTLLTIAMHEGGFVSIYIDENQSLQFPHDIDFSKLAQVAKSGLEANGRVMTQFDFQKVAKQDSVYNSASRFKKYWLRLQKKVLGNKFPHGAYLPWTLEEDQQTLQDLVTLANFAVKQSQ